MKYGTTRIALGVAALVTAGVGTVMTAPSASAQPDTACMRAGVDFLKDNGLFSTVAGGGLPVATAVAVGVTPRAGTDVSALPDVLPLSVVLADHRAGDDSLFMYPWC
jgi:hypothetical protein